MFSCNIEVNIDGGNRRRKAVKSKPAKRWLVGQGVVVKGVDCEEASTSNSHALCDG